MRAVDGDLGDPGQADEDAAALQRHHQPQRPGRLVPDGREDHDVPDTADRDALAVEQGAAPQPGREHLAVSHVPVTSP